MSKAPSSKHTPDQLFARNKPHLPRNQACQQCRKRKLKCDSKRPCSTCVKSHAHIVAPLAVRGVPFDPVPTCTYEDFSQPDTGVVPTVTATSSNAAQLKESVHSESRADPSKTQSYGNDSMGFNIHSDPTNIVGVGATFQDSPLGGFDYGQSTAPRSETTFTSIMLPPPNKTASRPRGITLEPTSTSVSSSSISLSMPPSTQRPFFSYTPIASMDSSPGFVPPLPIMLPSAYPPTLPPAILLRHLIDIFFSSVPYACRLIHRPSFLSAVEALPSSPNYPSTALLHAICASASLYSSFIDQKPRLDSSSLPMYQIHIQSEDFEMERGKAPSKRGAFAAEQSALARAMMEFDMSKGHKMLDAARAAVILPWYNYANAQWADAWFSTGYATRLSVCLGLNASTTYNPNSMMAWDSATLLPPTSDLLEQEQRRSVFWLAFINDRHHMIGTQWAGTFAEDDIGQELPGRLSDFELGILPPGPRQRLSDPDLLTNHPPHLTDAFTLHLKALILASRVGVFNVRMKVQRFSDISNGVLPPEAAFNPVTILSDYKLFADDAHGPSGAREPGFVPISELPAFKVLDNAIVAFQLGIPKEFRDPFYNRYDPLGFRGGASMSVDPHLYAAHVIPAVAMIMLHDPHADMDNQRDKSRIKISQATRLILESVYSLSATSYDVTLLPNQCMLYWLFAARALTRMYRVCLEQDHLEEAVVIRTEIDILSLVIGRIAEKLPVAHHNQLSLNGIVKKVERDVEEQKSYQRQQQHPETNNVGS